MTKNFRLILKASVGEFDEAFKEMYLPIAEASTAAMTQAGEIVKREGRASIAAAGKSQLWQNALRVEIYPGGKRARRVSVNAAAWIYHKIPYAGVYEDGAKVQGKPFMWIPMSHVPRKLGRDRLSAGLLKKRGAHLSIIKRGGKDPLLAIRTRLTKLQAARADRGNLKVSQALIKKGKGGEGLVRDVPLFTGIRVTDIKKKFNIRQICERAVGRLAQLYLENFKG